MREEENYFNSKWQVCPLLCEDDFQKEGRMVGAKDFKGCYNIF